MDPREELKSMLQDLINDRIEQAEVNIHNYIVAKTQQVAGFSNAGIENTNEAKAFAPNPYGNGHDDTPIKKGEMLTGDDGDYVEFLGVSNDGKRIIVRKAGKTINVDPAEFDVKISQK